jgi:predicted DNA binding CopG/RHH family protein
MPKIKNKPIPEIDNFHDEEERVIHELIEHENYVPKSLLTPGLRANYQSSARAKINETRVKISLRIPETDLARLKAKALREGMPYQTLIGSILHKAMSQ